MSALPAWSIGLIFGVGCFGLAFCFMLMSTAAEVLFGLMSGVVEALHELAGLSLGLSPVVGLVAGLIAWVVR